MSYEDRTLTCVQCGKEFTFTKGEQEFYGQKGFTSDPKRCKECRVSRKKGTAQQGGGIYRSPAFENSAPTHQRVRNGRRTHRRGQGQGQGRGRQEYRSPASYGNQAGSREYRSPAFREQSKLNPEQEYRAPGFREYAELKPEEEYRAPGFREHADIDLKEEYRAPAYRDLSKQYQDEKPLFEITCHRCGELAMVPFFPDEREDVFCQECYTLIQAEKAALESREEERKRENGQKVDNVQSLDFEENPREISTHEDGSSLGSAAGDGAE